MFKMSRNYHFIKRLVGNFKKYSVLLVLCAVIFVIELVKGITLKKECPSGEVHRSCAFIDEYTCWTQPDRMQRVKSPPKRLSHCKAGCYCKRGLVREFPGGPCIVAAGCRNRKLQAVLKNLPTAQPYFYRR